MEKHAAPPLAESVSITRPERLPGVEVMRFRSAQFQWRTVRTRFELCLVENGYAEWRAGSRRYVSRAGSVHLLPAGTFHCATSTPVASDFTLLVLADDLVAEGDRHGRTSFSVETHKADDQSLTSRAQALLAALASDDDPLRAETALALAMDAARATTGDLGPPHRKVRTAVLRMKELLHDRARHTLTLEEVAAAAGLSKYHAVRTFKSETGVTPFVFRWKDNAAHEVTITNYH